MSNDETKKNLAIFLHLTYAQQNLGFMTKDKYEEIVTLYSQEGIFEDNKKKNQYDFFNSGLYIDNFSYIR